MNTIKSFNQYIKESTGKSIGDRFKELIMASDSIEQELKFEDTVELNNIAGQLRKEYPGKFLDLDFMQLGNKFKIFLRCYDSKEDMDDQNFNSESTETQVSVPDDDDDMEEYGFRRGY
jgi:hypothetical protein